MGMTDKRATMTPQQLKVLEAAFSLLQETRAPINTQAVAERSGVQPWNIPTKVDSLADAGFLRLRRSGIGGGVIIYYARLPDGRQAGGELVVHDPDFNVFRFQRDLHDIQKSKIDRRCMSCRVVFRASRQQHMCSNCRWLASHDLPPDAELLRAA